MLVIDGRSDLRTPLRGRCLGRHPCPGRPAARRPERRPLRPRLRRDHLLARRRRRLLLRAARRPVRPRRRALPAHPPAADARHAPGALPRDRAARSAGRVEALRLTVNDAQAQTGRRGPRARRAARRRRRAALGRGAGDQQRPQPAPLRVRRRTSSSPGPCAPQAPRASA